MTDYYTKTAFKLEPAEGYDPSNISEKVYDIIKKIIDDPESGGCCSVTAIRYENCVVVCDDDKQAEMDHCILIAQECIKNELVKTPVVIKYILDSSNADPEAIGGGAIIIDEDCNIKSFSIDDRINKEINNRVIRVYRAQPTVTDINPVTIEIEEELPDCKNKTLQEIRGDFKAEAEKIIEPLFNTLPGGTVDQLFAAFCDKKASLLAVPIK